MADKKKGYHKESLLFTIIIGLSILAIIGFTYQEGYNKGFEQGDNWNYEWANIWEDKVRGDEDLDFGFYHGTYLCVDWFDERNPEYTEKWFLTPDIYLDYITDYSPEIEGYKYELKCKQFKYFNYNEMIEWVDDLQFKQEVKKT